MLGDAYEITSGPVCIRWPKTPPPLVGDDEVGRGLQARRDRKGNDVCLIGVGKLFAAAQEAADLLAADGISATVWDPRAAKPLDPAMLDDAAGHPLVVTAEDGLAEGGIGSSISASLSGRGPDVVVTGVPTEYLAHGKADAILSALGLDGPGLADTVRRRLRAEG